MSDIIITTGMKEDAKKCAECTCVHFGKPEKMKLQDLSDTVNFEDIPVDENTLYPKCDTCTALACGDECDGMSHFTK
jgi:hypothetical protein